MSGLQVKAELELRPWLRAWNALGKDQLPYATAATLTALAKAAQEDVRRTLPQRFTIRSTWTSRGIQIEPARKRDWPRQAAIIGSRDDHMRLQELGGIKRAKSGNLAIPTRLVKRKASGAVRAAERPSRLITSGKGYKTKSGKAIVLRDTKRTKRRVRVMFVLRPQARVRARFGFRETVVATVAREAQGTFARQLERALAARRA